MEKDKTKISKQYSWAENEVRLACKRENPNYDFDSPETEDNFDYGCACYKSALNAYNALCEDGHTGFSWSETVQILNDLCNGRPLTLIKDEDFFDDWPGSRCHPIESDAYLKEHGLKSNLQCPRMCSLFREETLDGKVSYHDVDRYIHINIECPSDTYHSGGAIIDEMFPISMPYMPKRKKYEIYEQTFLANPDNGDYDTRGVIYIKTPEGEKIDIGKYYTEVDNKWKEITREEYDKLLEKRIDTLPKKTADHICFILSEYVLGDEDNHFKIDDETRKKIEDVCSFFECPVYWKYNTYPVLHWLAGDNIILSDELSKKLENSKKPKKAKEQIAEIVKNLK